MEETEVTIDDLIAYLQMNYNGTDEVALDKGGWPYKEDVANVQDAIRKSSVFYKLKTEDYTVLFINN